MLIQIHGGGFHNRGAQLMLWTAMRELGRRLPEALFAVEPVWSSFQERASYDLLTLFPGVLPYRPRKGALILPIGGAISRILPRKIAATYGVARRCDIDALVDISGYAFGDKWPAVTSSSFAKRMNIMRRRGKPTILLPQMFGPFDDPATAAAFRPVVDGAALIYARDHMSLNCLESINATGREIRLAPDITIFTESSPPDTLPDTPYACLVPNARMRDKGGDTWGSRYLGLLVQVAERLKAIGITPYVVVHDGGNEDIVLAREIMDQISAPEHQLYCEDNPRKIKGFIAGAQMLIGSRFHAIVASLSSGTPAITLGWAHKYEELMQDFGVSEYLFRHDQESSELMALVDQLTDESIRSACEKNLRQHKSAMKVTSDEMWTDVVSELK